MNKKKLEVEKLSGLWAVTMGSQVFSVVEAATRGQAIARFRAMGFALLVALLALGCAGRVEIGGEPGDPVVALPEPVAFTFRIRESVSPEMVELFHAAVGKWAVALPEANFAFFVVADDANWSNVWQWSPESIVQPDPRRSYWSGHNFALTPSGVSDQCTQSDMVHAIGKALAQPYMPTGIAPASTADVGVMRAPNQCETEVTAADVAWLASAMRGEL